MNNRIFAIMIAVASLAACAYNPITQNPIFRPHEMGYKSGLRQPVKPDWSGQSVTAAEAFRHGGGEDGRTRDVAMACKMPGFQGMHIQYMQDVSPRATHYALFANGVHMPAGTCFGRPLSVVYADFDGDGYYDPALVAAPSSTELYVPIELPGQSLEIVGLRCTGSGRCARVWTKTVERTTRLVQQVDNHHGVTYR